MLHVTQVVVFDVDAPSSKLQRFSSSVHTVLNRASQQIVAAAKRLVKIFTRVLHNISTTKLIL